MGTRLAVGLCMSVLSLSAMARESLPGDVAKFVETHEACGHYRAEVGSAEMQKLCKGADKHLAQLRKKYAADPAVTQRLAEFKPGQQGMQDSALAGAMNHSGHSRGSDAAEEVMIDPDP